jgi:replicative DNA helicase
MDLLKRVPPQNIEAEQSVLGAILLDNESLDRIADRLVAEHFYRESHREIFRAMVNLAGRNIGIDALTLTDALRTAGVCEAVGGVDYIAELAACVPSAANIDHYAKIVREKALLRALASKSMEHAAQAYDGPEDGDVEALAQRQVDEFTEVGTSGVQHHTVWGPELAKGALDHVKKAFERKSRITGLETGLLDLDS